MVVRKWNPANDTFETLSHENSEGQQEEIAYQEACRNMDFDKYMGAYPQANAQQWIGLSNYITQEVIARIDPISHVILSEEKERELRDIEEEEVDTYK